MAGHKEDFQRVREKLRDRLRLFYGAIVLECHRRVVLRTPVDTGRAKGNWQIGNDMPTVSLNRLDPTGSAAIAEAIAFAQTLTLEDVTWIINNLVYIRSLEYGHSSQAPDGMVGVTAAEVHLIAEEMLTQLGNAK